MAWHNPSIDSAHVVKRANPVTMRTDQKWISISHGLTPGKTLNTAPNIFLHHIQCHFVHHGVSSHTLLSQCCACFCFYSVLLPLLFLSWLVSPFCLLWQFCQPKRWTQIMSDNQCWRRTKEWTKLDSGWMPPLYAHIMHNAKMMSLTMSFDM